MAFWRHETIKEDIAQFQHGKFLIHFFKHARADASTGYGYWLVRGFNEDSEIVSRGKGFSTLDDAVGKVMDIVNNQDTENNMDLDHNMIIG